MVLAAVVLAICVVLRAVAQRRNSVLLVIGVAAIPVGVGVATCAGPEAPRTRIAVSFIGYRVPLSLIEDCSTPSRVWTKHGVWIGGGSRYDGDAAPDTVAIPGFRPRLLRLCSDGAPLAAQKFSLLPVQPGLDLVSNATRYEVPTDAHTQRVVLDGVGSATRNVARWDANQCVGAVPAKTIEAFAMETWKSDDRALARTKRARLLAMRRQVTGPPGGSDVLCVDLSSGAPRRCAGDPADARNLLFLWREPRTLRPSYWSGLSPLNAPLAACGAKGPASGDSVTIPASDIAPDTVLSAKTIESLPGVRVRMISRRFTASTADRNVRRAVERFSPAPYRLGSSRVIRFARSESDLLLFVREPSVQHRLDDLFGKAAVDALPRGNFDLVFGDPGLGQGLITDLASEAEEFLPKPLFEKWRSRISMNERSNDYLERSIDALPRTHHFGEVATFGSDAAGVRPLVLLQRVVPPTRTWLMPLLAALFLIVPLLDATRRRRVTGIEWDLAALTFALLTFRWMIATRALLDAPDSDAHRFSWSFDGAFLLLAPIFIVILQPRLQQWWQRSSGESPASHAPLFASSVSAAAAAIAAALWIVFSNATVVTAAWVAAYILGSIVAITAGVLAALLFYRVLRRFPRDADDDTLLTPAPAAPAPAAPAAPASRQNRWKNLGEATPRKRENIRMPDVRGALRTAFTPSLAWGWFVSSWWTVALVCGLLLLAIRFGGILIGLQEQLATVRLDVLFLPAVAAGFALLSRHQERREIERLAALALFALLALFGVGYVVNDLGLLWVGAMAMVLALPFVSARPRYAAFAALLLFLAAFLSPKFLSEPFLWGLKKFGGTTYISQSQPDEISFPDVLQVQRDRDHYRMLDTVQSELVEEIPSQLAREVVLDRERVRYQATSGAWRAGFRESATAGNDVTGAGYLRAKPIIGQSTFRDAAQSDYVYPLYVRSEFGWTGLLALVSLYLAMFVAVLFPSGVRRRPSRLAVWSLALAAGTALFMIGGTSALFPFSGKWPLFLAFASESDLALGIALVLLGTTEEDAP